MHSKGTSFRGACGKIFRMPYLDQNSTFMDRQAIGMVAPGSLNAPGADWITCTIVLQSYFFISSMAMGLSSSVFF